MRVRFFVFGKVNFIGIKTSRQLTCLYIGPLIFFCQVWPKMSKKNYYAYFSLTLILLIRIWVAVGGGGGACGIISCE